MLLIVNQSIRLTDIEGQTFNLPYSFGEPKHVPDWVGQHPDFALYVASGALVEVNSPIILPAGYTAPAKTKVEAPAAQDAKPDSADKEQKAK